MRVIAGLYRSRILKSLKGLALRPTSDRLRETIFNVLAPNIAGSRFIDLFAGTGAIGIEALSRGAAEVEGRSEEHTSELQSRLHLVCRLLLEKKTPHHTHSDITTYAPSHHSHSSPNPRLTIHPRHLVH